MFHLICSCNKKHVSINVQQNYVMKTAVYMTCFKKEMALLYEKQLAKGGIATTQQQDDTIDETWVSQVSIEDPELKYIALSSIKFSIQSDTFSG